MAVKVSAKATLVMILAVVLSIVILVFIGGTALTFQILRNPLVVLGHLVAATMEDIYSWTIVWKGGVVTPWNFIKALVFLVAVYYGYQLFVVPMNRVRLLGDVGYIAEGGRSAKEMVGIVQKRRLVGKVPPVYPNGWFSVLESRDLEVGEAKSVSCIGKNLAVFRGEDGRAQVIDTYCPHMGANLAVGGRVSGNCIECPFHGWQFRGDDGKCTHIPYCDPKHIPETAKVNAYEVLERNGFIYIWNHAEGNEPDWIPPEIPEIASGQWTYRGRTEHIVNAHIQEIPENGADVAHLPQVHKPIMTAGVDLRQMYSKFWSFGQHDWVANWEVDVTEKHVGVLKLRHSIKLFGKNFRAVDMDVVARQIGPGIVYLTFDSVFGRGAYLMSLTPTEPLTQRMIHHGYFNKYTPNFIGKFFLLGEALMIERDIMIWNNKKYEGKPVFVKSAADSLISRHRRWYSQFYSEHSPRLENMHAQSLDW